MKFLKKLIKPNIGTDIWDADVLVNENGQLEIVFNKDHIIKSGDKIELDLTLTIDKLQPGYITHLK